MASPISFLQTFRAELHAAGIWFALTSGQACVYYGIQQTTKDSDWILHPNDLPAFRTMLTEAGADGRYRASYRSVCGAPLESAWHRNGWTSHLLVEDVDQTEHHINIFCKPPRVSSPEPDPIEPDYAARHVVAQMKKTDRDKDWPIVATLSRQLADAGDERALLHGVEPEWLSRLWRQIPESHQAELVRQRPLLQLIDTGPRRLPRAIAVERQIWMSVNRARYHQFQKAWKDWFRIWRNEPGFQWPLAAAFSEQHEHLTEAAHTHRLSECPLDEPARCAAFESGVRKSSELMAATDQELAQIVPPLETLLP